MTSPDTIWTRAFALLCLAQFLGYAHHFVLQPTLPLYITSLGGTPFVVGVVIAAFGATSVIFRPLIGAWADRWHGGGVMLYGLLFIALSVPFLLLAICRRDDPGQRSARYRLGRDEYRRLYAARHHRAAGPAR